MSRSITKYVALTFDESKAALDMDLAEIILNQFGLELQPEKPYIVQEMYMPEEEQNKMQKYMMKTEIMMTIPGMMREKSLDWMRLDVFPSTINWNERVVLDKKELDI